MIQTLKEIILDSQQSLLSKSVPRHIELTFLQGKATVCIGVRRSGKSTLMTQMMQKIMKNGVSRENILHLNFFDDRLHDLKQEGPSAVLEAYYGLYPQKKKYRNSVLFF